MSNLENKQQTAVVRLLSGKDAEQIKRLDDLSGDYMEQWVAELEANESSDGNYGIFLKGDTLIGYCGLNTTEDSGDEIEDHIDAHHSKRDDTRLLYTVYIDDSYQGQGYGKQLISEAIEDITDPTTKQTIYVKSSCYGLKTFYESIGFKSINDEANYLIMALIR